MKKFKNALISTLGLLVMGTIFSILINCLIHVPALMLDISPTITASAVLVIVIIGAFIAFLISGTED